MTKKKEEGNTGLQPNKSPVRNILTYARCRARGHNKTYSKLKAGYSPNYSTSQLEKALINQQIIKDVQEAREDLQRTLGLTLHDTVEFAEEIRDNPASNDSDRLKANKQIIEQLGYNAPILIDVEEKSMIMEFKGLTIDDLQALKHGLTPINEV